MASEQVVATAIKERERAENEGRRILRAPAGPTGNRKVKTTIHTAWGVFAFVGPPTPQTRTSIWGRELRSVNRRSRSKLPSKMRGASLQNRRLAVRPHARVRSSARAIERKSHSFLVALARSCG